jgi:flagellar hook-associated protein FlgK
MAKRKRSWSAAVAETAPKKSSLKERIGWQADSMASTIMDEHPMMKKLRKSISKEIMRVTRGVARNPRGIGKVDKLFGR